MNTRDWDLEDYIDKLYPCYGDGLSEYFTDKASPTIPDKDVSDVMLRESYNLAAQIVATYGETYLPIFERLQREVDSRNRRRALIDTAIKAAEQNSNTDREANLV